MPVKNHEVMPSDRTFKPVTGVRIPLGSSPLPSEIAEGGAAGAVKNGHPGPPQSHHGEAFRAHLLRRVLVSPRGCWLFQGAIERNGYGAIKVAGRKRIAHRAYFETFRGPIAEGLTLDHLCRVRHCVNPEHLEPVTRRENTLRGISPVAKNVTKTTCPRGHALLAVAWGGRRCVECRKEWSRKGTRKRSADRAARRASR